jgi:hypothetical protein
VSNGKCHIAHHAEEKHGREQHDQPCAQGVAGFEDWEFRFHR